MAKFNVTYDIVTEESAECGDTAENGFISQGVGLRDAIKDLFQTRTNAVDGVSAIELSGYPVQYARWLTVTNGMEYETGDYESRSLHFPKNITPSSIRRIAKLCGARV